MKKFTAIGLAVLAALSAIPAQAQAQSSDEVGKWFVGPRLGLMGTDSDRAMVRNNTLLTFKGGLDTQFGGIEAGFQFTPEWGYRIYYDALTSDLEAGGSASGRAFGTDVLYNFSDNFYGAVGINATEIGDINNRFLRIGAGYKNYINDDLALTLEAGVQQSDTDLTEFLFQTSLRWYFGGSSYTPAKAQPQTQTVAPAVTETVVDKDSDGDGVLDSKDKCPNTQAGYKVDGDGCVMYADEIIRRNLLINFGFDSTTIPAAGKADIEATANFLKEYPQLEIVIEGHTDDTGAASYNLGLSERRAKAVGDSLVKDFGIAAARVRTVGYGETQPLVPNDSRENRAKNRRIEAEMSVTKKVPVKQ